MHNSLTASDEIIEKTVFPYRYLNLYEAKDNTLIFRISLRIFFSVFMM